MAPSREELVQMLVALAFGKEDTGAHDRYRPLLRSEYDRPVRCGTSGADRLSGDLTVRSAQGRREDSPSRPSESSSTTPPFIQMS